MLAMIMQAGKAVQNGWGEMWRGMTLASDTKLRIKLREEFLNPAQVNLKKFFYQNTTISECRKWCYMSARD